MFVSVQYSCPSLYLFHNQNLVIRSTFVFLGVGEVGDVGVGGAMGVEGN